MISIQYSTSPYMWRPNVEKMEETVEKQIYNRLGPRVTSKHCKPLKEVGHLLAPPLLLGPVGFTYDPNPPAEDPVPAGGRV
jgi:hypothetical protein